MSVVAEPRSFGGLPASRACPLQVDVNQDGRRFSLIRRASAGRKHDARGHGRASDLEIATAATTNTNARTPVNTGTAAARRPSQPAALPARGGSTTGTAGGGGCSSTPAAGAPARPPPPPPA